jgi:hypothetical protein
MSKISLKNEQILIVSLLKSLTWSRIGAIDARPIDCSSTFDFAWRFCEMAGDYPPG